MLERATSIPARLKTYAIAQVEAAVVSGQGPTRTGATLDHAITAGDIRLLRRALYAPASDGQAGISQAEAEMLVRIKDATLDATNVPEWQELFVKGVANFLLGFGGDEPLSAARAQELEAFMENHGQSIGGFLARMAAARTSGADNTATIGSEPLADFNIHAAEHAAINAGERQWLDQLLHSDTQLDPLEKALIKFIAEETGEVFGISA